MGCKISVLIPTFKPEDYIKSCLESLESQTLNNSDYVVYIALNGERFPYESYIESLLENYTFQWRFFYLPCTGVSNARNFLLRHSEEPFVCFVDDDDALSENYLESLLSVADNESIAISNVKCFLEDSDHLESNYIGNSYARLAWEETSILKARKFFSSPWAKLIHRKIISNTTFDTRLSRGEDALFMAQISPRVKRIKKSSSEPCYYVRQRPGSATRKNVQLSGEFKRVCYLLLCYVKMIFSSRYNSSFVATRIVATILYLRHAFLK